MRSNRHCVAAALVATAFGSGLSATAGASSEPEWRGCFPNRYKTVLQTPTVVVYEVSRAGRPPATYACHLRAREPLRLPRARYAARYLVSGRFLVTEGTFRASPSDKDVELVVHDLAEGRVVRREVAESLLRVNLFLVTDAGSLVWGEHAFQSRSSPLSLYLSDSRGRVELDSGDSSTCCSRPAFDFRQRHLFWTRDICAAPGACERRPQVVPLEPGPARERAVVIRRAPGERSACFPATSRTIIRRGGVHVFTREVSGERRTFVCRDGDKRATLLTRERLAPGHQDARADATLTPSDLIAYRYNDVAADSGEGAPVELRVFDVAGRSVVRRAGRLEPGTGQTIRAFAPSYTGGLAWTTQGPGTHTSLNVSDDRGEREVDASAADGSYTVHPTALAIGFATEAPTQPLYWYGTRCGADGCAIEPHVSDVG